MGLISNQKVWDANSKKWRKVEDLKSQSNLKVECQCDFCGKIKTIKYQDYNKNTKNQTVPYACCQKCAVKKREITCVNKYGVKNPAQVKEVQNKIKETNMSKYGGPAPYCNKTIQQKGEATCIDNYGVRNPAQNNEIKDKIKETNKERYGVENPMQNKTIRNKCMETLIANSKVPMSKQEKEINDIISKKYKTETQVPYGGFSVDILIEYNGITLAVECDGYHWHMENNEDVQKDIIRDKILKSQYGIDKILRIVYNRNIPTETEILDAVDSMFTSNHSFYRIFAKN